MLENILTQIFKIWDSSLPHVELGHIRTIISRQSENFQKLLFKSNNTNF